MKLSLHSTLTTSIKTKQLVFKILLIFRNYLHNNSYSLTIYFQFLVPNPAPTLNKKEENVFIRPNIKIYEHSEWFSYDFPKSKAF
jgi:hypothetical protein